MIVNLLNRRAALRELDIGQRILWAVVSGSVSSEMRMIADAAAKIGVSISQQQMITVSPKADQMPFQIIVIERVL